MYLTKEELPKYYKPADSMDANDVSKYLQRANAYAAGEIGGQLKEAYIDENLKAAVATAFEILSEGETAQTDPVNGNITEAAPDNYGTRNKKDPLQLVKTMLTPYKLLFDRQNSSKSDRSIQFL